MSGFGVWCGWGVGAGLSLRHSIPSIRLSPFLSLFSHRSFVASLGLWLICVDDGGGWQELCRLIIGCLATLSGREGSGRDCQSGLGLMMAHLVCLGTVC